MSTPNTDGDNDANTFAAQVDSTVNQFIKGEDGKLTLPDGVEVSEDVLYTAKIEMRRRDTYSSFSRERNTNVSLQAQNKALTNSWKEDAITNLSAADQAELAELKGSDIDAYLSKVDELKTKALTNFEEKQRKVKEVANDETELQRRTRLIQEHNETNPEFQLTDDVIANDVPPRLTKQLASGELSFDEFIVKAAKYISTPKVIGDGKKVTQEPNLGKSGGNSTPSDNAIEADIRESYKKTVF